MKARMLLTSVYLLSAVMLSSCNNDEWWLVDRTVELHYINGEVETRKFRGYSDIEPYIRHYRGDYMYVSGDTEFIHIPAVVRFKVLRVDTVPHSYMQYADSNRGGVRGASNSIIP